MEYSPGLELRRTSKTVFQTFVPVKAPVHLRNPRQPADTATHETKMTPPQDNSASPHRYRSMDRPSPSMSSSRRYSPPAPSHNTQAWHSPSNNAQRQTPGLMNRQESNPVSAIARRNRETHSSPPVMNGLVHGAGSAGTGSPHQPRGDPHWAASPRMDSGYPAPYQTGPTMSHGPSQTAFMPYSPAITPIVTPPRHTPVHSPSVGIGGYGIDQPDPSLPRLRPDDPSPIDIPRGYTTGPIDRAAPTPPHHSHMHMPAPVPMSVDPTPARVPSPKPKTVQPVPMTPTNPPQHITSSTQTQTAPKPVEPAVVDPTPTQPNPEPTQPASPVPRLDLTIIAPPTMEANPQPTPTPTHSADGPPSDPDFDIISDDMGSPPSPAMSVVEDNEAKRVFDMTVEVLASKLPAYLKYDEVVKLLEQLMLLDVSEREAAVAELLGMYPVS